MSEPALYDPRCHDLAGTFLADEEGATDADRDALARVIQGAIEDWLLHDPAAPGNRASTLAERWNAAHPVGTLVVYDDDRRGAGRVVRTAGRAWVFSVPAERSVGDGVAVVLVEGGECVPLARCRPAGASAHA